MNLTERMVSQFRRVKDDTQLEVLSRFQLQTFSRGSNPCISNPGDDQQKTFNVELTVKCSGTIR